MSRSTKPKLNLIERRMSRFLREPPSVKTAASVIVTATFVIVLIVVGIAGLRLVSKA